MTILVERPDGKKEAVRVGTAVREGEGFRLSLGELSIGAAPDRASSRSSGAPPSHAPSRGDGMVLPPYGRSKGAPIAGASISDLEYYIQGSRRSLDDPSKARWHDKERVLLAAMEAELQRQQGGGARGEDRSRGGGTDAFDPGGFDPDSVPYSDDDIPF